MSSGDVDTRALRVLVVRAQMGDRDALDAVLRTVQLPLYRHALAILHDSDAAEDALQETLFLVARRLGTLRDPGWFRAWAYRIATREAVRHSRGAKRWVEALRGDDALNAIPQRESDEVPDPELIASIPLLVEGLPPASGAVVRMHYLDGLTQVEIAEALEIPVGTVKSRLGYGLASLRRAMAVK